MIILPTKRIFRNFHILKIDTMTQVGEGRKKGMREGEGRAKKGKEYGGKEREGDRMKRGERKGGGWDFAPFEKFMQATVNPH